MASMTSCSNTSTPEYRTLVKNSHEITDTLKQCCRDMGPDLFARKLISNDLRDSLADNVQPAWLLAGKVTNALIDRVKHHTSDYDEFWESLASQKPFTDALVKKLNNDLESLQKGTTSLESSPEQLSTQSETELDDQTRANLHGRLLEDSRRIEETFGKFLSGFRKSLKDRNVAPVEIARNVLALKAITKQLAADTELLCTTREKLRASKTVDDVFDHVDPYISFFNYDVIQYIVNLHGDSNDKSNFATYLEKFEEYCNRKATEFRPNVHCEDPNTTKLVVKIDSDFTSTYTMKAVLQFRAKLCEILKVTEFCLLLETITSGCILVTFLLPTFVVPHIFPLNQDQERALSAEGVIGYSLDNEPYKEINQQNRQVDDTQSMPTPTSQLLPQTSVPDELSLSKLSLSAPSQLSPVSLLPTLSPLLPQVDIPLPLLELSEHGKLKSPAKAEEPEIEPSKLIDDLPRLRTELKDVVVGTVQLTSIAIQNVDKLRKAGTELARNSCEHLLQVVGAAHEYISEVEDLFNYPRENEREIQEATEKFKQGDFQQLSKMINQLHSILANVYQLHSKFKTTCHTAKTSTSAARQECTQKKAEANAKKDTTKKVGALAVAASVGIGFLTLGASIPFSAVAFGTGAGIAGGTYLVAQYFEDAEKFFEGVITTFQQLSTDINAINRVVGDTNRALDNISTVIKEIERNSKSKTGRKTFQSTWLSKVRSLRSENNLEQLEDDKELFTWYVQLLFKALSKNAGTNTAIIRTLQQKQDELREATRKI